MFWVKLRADQCWRKSLACNGISSSTVATLTPWGRAEFTTTCKNWLELLFKAKQCYSFIVNIRGECYLQGCALIFLRLLKQHAHRRIHSPLKLRITTMTYSTIHFEHSWKAYLILLLLFLPFLYKVSAWFYVSSSASIYLHGSVDINSAILIYTACFSLIIIFIFCGRSLVYFHIHGRWRRFAFSEQNMCDVCCEMFWIGASKQISEMYQWSFGAACMPSAEYIGYIGWDF